MSVLIINSLWNHFVPVYFHNFAFDSGAYPTRAHFWQSIWCMTMLVILMWSCSMMITMLVGIWKNETLQWTWKNIFFTHVHTIWFLLVSHSNERIYAIQFPISFHRLSQLAITLHSGSSIHVFIGDWKGQCDNSIEVQLSENRRFISRDKRLPSKLQLP